MTTPLRSLDRPEYHGCAVLTEGRATYADGGEARILEIVEAATDRSADSVELERSITDWPTNYHLSPARTNALRLLNIPHDARVLEVGAGCGTMTRYLGEQAALVDAVEPMGNRARVAAARCADLEGVAVFIGGIEDVPAESEYDIVVVWGVLEYVAEGASETDKYLAFLERCRGVLADGGHLVIAIENALGVKYMCGSPEDHSGRPYDSVEGYLRRPPARVFSRKDLLELLATAGSDDNLVLQAMPDYKMTRALLSDAAFDDAALQRIATDVPKFPSPDRGIARWPAASECEMWHTLVRAGLGAQFGNSFVVISGPTPEVLWPAERVGAFASTSRGLPYRTLASFVRDESGAVRVLRRYVREVEGEPDSRSAGSLRHQIELEEEYLDGPSLFDRMIAAEDVTHFLAQLDTWRSIVETALSTNPGLLDLAPHNIKIVDDEAVVAFDQEWCDETWDTEAILARLSVVTAHAIADRMPCDGWMAQQGLHTVGDLATFIATNVGVGSPGWLDAHMRREAEFVCAAGVAGVNARPEDSIRTMMGSLNEPLATKPPTHAQYMRQQFSQLARTVQSQQQELALLKQRV